MEIDENGDVVFGRIIRGDKFVIGPPTPPVTIDVPASSSSTEAKTDLLKEEIHKINTFLTKEFAILLVSEDKLEAYLAAKTRIWERIQEYFSITNELES